MTSTTEQGVVERNANDAYASSDVTIAESAEPTASTLEQGVKELSDALLEAMEGSSLQERVDALGAAVANIECDVREWRGWRKGPDLESFEGLQSQVEAIKSEWEGLTTTFQSQRERLDTLLRSFPGVVEISTVRALALRLENLERLVEQLVTEHSTAATARAGRRQLVVSLVALGITVSLWTIWIVLSLSRG